VPKRNDKECRTSYTDVHSRLLITAKKQKPFRCPSAYEWIRKLWYLLIRKHDNLREWRYGKCYDMVVKQVVTTTKGQKANKPWTLNLLPVKSTLCILAFLQQLSHKTPDKATRSEYLQTRFPLWLAWAKISGVQDAQTNDKQRNKPCIFACS
jgi:hypothetical protein